MKPFGGREDFRNKRITVMGLGVLGGGVGVARYLSSQGAQVTVTDTRTETDLIEAIRMLDGLPITFHLGKHEIEDFQSTRADMVVRNPGVPHDSPYLLAARKDGLRVEMEMSIFFRRCPSSILGVTGTKGKTTVSGLLGEIMRAWRADALTAGNMGISALLALDRLAPDTPVVIELSSFQIESLNEHALGPHVAVITNISEDHLDRYESFEAYASTKRRLTRSMTPDNVVVYNRDDPEASRIVSETSSQLLSFGLTEPAGDGAWMQGVDLVLRHRDIERSFQRPLVLSLQGDHGALNTLAAISAAHAYGVPVAAIETGLSQFQGVKDRLEQVAVIEGVTFVNDTSATAPIAAVAGLNVLGPFARTLHLIAGGADKRSDLSPFADEIRNTGAVVYLLDGTATNRLKSLLHERDVTTSGPFASMRDAVSIASNAAVEGDIVALCPGCASFGMFRNEFDRGEQFRSCVRSWERHRAALVNVREPAGHIPPHSVPGSVQEGLNDGQPGP